jgi:hypothetical protein
MRQPPQNAKAGTLARTGLSEFQLKSVQRFI